MHIINKLVKQKFILCYLFVFFCQIFIPLLTFSLFWSSSFLQIKKKQANKHQSDRNPTPQDLIYCKGVNYHAKSIISDTWTSPLTEILSSDTKNFIISSNQRSNDLHYCGHLTLTLPSPTPEHQKPLHWAQKSATLPKTVMTP